MCQILQPSERNPGACMMLVEMLTEAGAPPGVVNVIHGTHDSVNFICRHPDIQAISFVGSDQAVRFHRFYFSFFSVHEFIFPLQMIHYKFKCGIWFQ